MVAELSPSAVRSESPETIPGPHDSNHVHFGFPQSTEPEAGPSSPRSPTHPLVLTTSRDTDADNTLLDQAINAKRRKSSLLPGIHLHYPQRKRKDSAGSDSHDGIHESPEALSVPGGGKTGPTVPDIADHTETDEGRALEEELAVLLKEAEEARGLDKKEISLLYGAKGKGKDPEVWKGFPDMEDPTGEYVWEFLYENQRGLFAFGKAYFSSSALFPADPTAYTLPNKPLPEASSKFILSNRDGDPTVVHSSKDKSSGPRRRINTAYTPETYQLPSPSWEWMTSWMINMRTGTDEMGWRYNAWFKKKGWRSKAGRAGWGGWVRRREWIRLRRAVADRGDEEDTRPRGLLEEHHDNRKKPRTLEQVMGEGERADLLALVKELEMVSLDREKLEIWTRWLEGVEGNTKERLQALLDDPDSCHTLFRQFMYRSTSKRLEVLLAEHDLTLPKTPSTASRPLSRSSTKESIDSSQARSQPGYDVSAQ